MPTTSEILAAIDDWPVDSAAAGLIRGDGTVETHGPTDKPFPLASVTKLLTAAAVLVGVEEGSLELDDPIFDEGATVADLLGHAAGIGPDGARLDQPGRRRVYSNAGYEVAADALVDATDIPFDTYFDEALVQPLDMADTQLVSSPAYGAVSSVDDLLAFASGLARVLAAETLARMTTPHLPELSGVLPGYGRQSPNQWGLGPELRSAKSPHWTGDQNSPHTWGHFGQAGTFLWVDPIAHTTLVVLTDRKFGDWALEIWPELSDSVLGFDPPTLG